MAVPLASWMKKVYFTCVQEVFRERIARSLLVHAFATDILEHIKLAPIRDYVDKLISERLEFDIA